VEQLHRLASNLSALLDLHQDVAYALRRSKEGGEGSMMWERVSWYKSDFCIVCGVKTRDCVAPQGIASGSFPCHISHPNHDIMMAYFALLDKHFQEQDKPGA
jgi:hypothetical protein